MCAEVGVAVGFVPAPQGWTADARRIGEPPRNAEAMDTFAREIDEVWYESNAACGRQFVWLGAALMVVAGALTVFEWRTPDDYALAMCGVLMFSTVVLAFWGLATAREVRKRVEGTR